MTTHCPTCTCTTPTPHGEKCACGHPRMSHNDNGGRNKKAYCTQWVHGPKGEQGPMIQCRCYEFRAAVDA